MRRALLACMAVAVVAAPLTGVAPATALPVDSATRSVATAPPAGASSIPGRARGIGDARQLIVVTAPYGTSFARLSAYELGVSGWREVMAPIPARIGLNGFAKPGQRRQGTYTSPTGTFALGPSFGNGASPGTAMPYREVDGTDRWVYDRSDPSTYNTYQPSGNWGNQERLARMGRTYRYVVVIGFNQPRMSMSPTARPAASRTVNTRAGGGIFLHVTGGHLNGATAGCVSVAEPAMRSLLRWLRPAAHPRIVMGPSSVVLAPARTSGIARAATGTSTTRFGTSRGGRALTVTRIGPATARHRLLVVGVIHGDERHGARVVTALRTTPLPADTAIWLVPTMNPDGYAANSRRNGAGVDLNRNFPFSWRSSARGTSRYSGPRPASEPETKAMMGLLDSVSPTLVTIFHSPLYGVDSDGAKSMVPVRRLAAGMGFPVSSFTCNGGCHGTLTQWFNRNHPGQAVTIEFAASRPSDALIARIARTVVSVTRSLP